MDPKSRGRTRYRHLRDEKLYRTADTNKQMAEVFPRDGVNGVDGVNVMKSKFYRYRRFRTESPPPNRRRRRTGQNKGNAKVCTFCRPEISRRMMQLSNIRRECRGLWVTEF